MLELMLAIGFSSALIHPVEGKSNLNSLFVHSWGGSSKGKTTGVQLALFVWGLPDNSKGGLLRTWNSTDNALAASLRGNRGVVVGFDEASMSLSSDFSRLIYQLAEGQEKARLDDRSNFQEAGEWRTTILSTGEFSLLERSRQNTGLRENYGYAGPALVRLLFSSDWDLVDRVWERWRDRVKQQLPGGQFDQRVGRGAP